MLTRTAGNTAASKMAIVLLFVALVESAAKEIGRSPATAGVKEPSGDMGVLLDLLPAQ